jgi:hypothetical protein
MIHAAYTLCLIVVSEYRLLDYKLHKNQILVKAMKLCEVVEVYLHSFLTSTLDGCRRLSLRVSRSTAGEISPGTH